MPTCSPPGLEEPAVIPAAFFSKKLVGGVRTSNSNVRSLKAVSFTGVGISGIYLLVRSLNCLTASGVKNEVEPQIQLAKALGMRVREHTRVCRVTARIYRTPSMSNHIPRVKNAQKKHVLWFFFTHQTRPCLRRGDPGSVLSQGPVSRQRPVLSASQTSPQTYCVLFLTCRMGGWVVVNGESFLL